MLACRLVVMSATLSDDLAQRLTRLMSSSAPVTVPSADNGATTNGGTCSAHTASQQNSNGGSCNEGVSELSQNAVQGPRDMSYTSTGSCRILSCKGRMFPVATKYMGWQGVCRESSPLCIPVMLPMPTNVAWHACQNATASLYVY